uniref:Uncharacterized protein n=1 Tax=Aplanochytrium stocchinoi TaxID=215587 RepID=A0A7S3PD91_9STRA|mmetsp:Transcript_32222/g.39636  ORF Transcript_32222/g.39636 Transcript_32222/m.39636 type:complete len:524 (+) Transcript_32222:133-1704(+)
MKYSYSTRRCAKLGILLFGLAAVFDKLTDATRTSLRDFKRELGGGKYCSTCTWTQGGWLGSEKCKGKNPACYLEANFDSTFPNGVILGVYGERWIKIDTYDGAYNIEQGGKPGSLPKTCKGCSVGDDCEQSDCDVEGKSSSNNMLSQTLALTFNVYFSNCTEANAGDEMPCYVACDPSNNVPLGEKIIKEGYCKGMTVMEVLDKANCFLAYKHGCQSQDELTSYLDCVNLINENGADAVSCQETNVPTPLIPTPQPTAADVPTCPPNANLVLEFDFENSDITINNLGGYCGGDATLGTSCGEGIAQVIRYENIGVYDEKSITLVISNTSYYEPLSSSSPCSGQSNTNGYCNNGIYGKLGQVNLRNKQVVELRFSFVFTGTNIEAQLSEWDLTFLDINTGKCTCTSTSNQCSVCNGCPTKKPQARQTLEIASDIIDAGPFLDEDTTVCESSNSGELKFWATRYASGNNHPSDPHNLTQVQQEETVGFRFKDRSYIDVTFGLVEGNTAYGRNFEFAGKSNLAPCG